MPLANQFRIGGRVRPLASGLAMLVTAGAGASLSIAGFSSEAETAAVREVLEPVPAPPLPALDAPKRPFPEALLHLTLLEAEFFEEQLERLDEGAFDLGFYSEMYEFFRVESRRLSEQYPENTMSYDSPELAEASARLTRARQTFQTSRFVAEQLENREKLGLDSSPRLKDDFEQRTLALFRDYTAHYREAADRILKADPGKLEHLFQGIRGEGLRLNRRLRQFSADFPDRPTPFDGAFTEEPLRSASQELQAALNAYQDARKQRARELANSRASDQEAGHS